MEILKIFRGDIDFLSEGCRIYKFRFWLHFGRFLARLIFYWMGSGLLKNILDFYQSMAYGLGNGKTLGFYRLPYTFKRYKIYRPNIILQKKYFGFLPIYGRTYKFQVGFHFGGLWSDIEIIWKI